MSKTNLEKTHDRPWRQPDC